MWAYERVIAVAAGLEASVLGYAALTAFLTPTESRAHDVVSALLLVALALPLGWHAANVFMIAERSSDQLIPYVALPNLLLLSMAMAGILGSRGLVAAATACATLAIGAAAVRLSQERSTAPDRPSIGW